MWVKKGLVPPTGWHMMYGDVRIDGYDWDDTLKRMRAYNVANGFPAGDEEVALKNYICSTFPHHCSQNSPAQKEKNGQMVHTKPRLMDRISDWLRYMKQHRIPLIGFELATQRGNVCRDCPKNRKWDTCNTCGDVIGSIRQAANVVREGRVTQYDQHLLGCELYGMELKSAVWISASSARHPKSPASCWVGT